MKWWAIIGYGLSVAVHFGLAAGVTSIPKQQTRKPTAVTVFEAKRDKKKAEPDKKEKPPEPPKPVTVPKHILKAAAEPPPVPDNTPPPPQNTSPTPAGHAEMAALPDFGIALGGGVAAGGIAVPAGGGSGSRGPSGGGGGSEKKVRAVAPKPSDASDGCVEETTKPKSVDRAQPQYTDEARSANVEGVVSVEFRIGPDGQVIDARVVRGLGHGLDQAALAAAKRWKFSPAMRCGKPVEAKHVVNMRFQLGD